MKNTSKAIYKNTQMHVHDVRTHVDMYVLMHVHTVRTFFESTQYSLGVTYEYIPFYLLPLSSSRSLTYAIQSNYMFSSNTLADCR